MFMSLTKKTPAEIAHAKQPSKWHSCIGLMLYRHKCQMCTKFNKTRIYSVAFVTWARNVCTIWFNFRFELHRNTLASIFHSVCLFTYADRHSIDMNTASNSVHRRNSKLLFVKLLCLCRHANDAVWKSIIHSHSFKDLFRCFLFRFDSRI